MKIKAKFQGRTPAGFYRWKLTRNGEHLGYYICPVFYFWNGTQLPNIYL